MNFGGNGVYQMSFYYPGPQPGYMMPPGFHPMPQEIRPAYQTMPQGMAGGYIQQGGNFPSGMVSIQMFGNQAIK